MPSIAFDAILRTSERNSSTTNSVMPSLPRTFEVVLRVSRILERVLDRVGLSEEGYGNFGIRCFKVYGPTRESGTSHKWMAWYRYRTDDFNSPNLYHMADGTILTISPTAVEMYRHPDRSLTFETPSSIVNLLDIVN